MASLRLIKRQKKRAFLVSKYWKKREELRIRLRKSDVSSSEKQEVQNVFQKLPKDSNLCRLRNRCFLTGRGRGVYRTVGLCRNMFRYYAMRGDIPGVRKSSW